MAVEPREPGPPNQADVGDITPQPRYRNVERRLLVQELVRTGLALFFAVILLVTIVDAFANVSGPGWTNTKELLQILLPAETALLGSAVGFYFGTQK